MKLTIDEIRANLLAGQRITDLPLRVTAYVRVSTDHEEQKSSLLNQEQYFEGKIAANRNWTYVPLYKDEAKSGTSVQGRRAFLQMMEDAKQGRFDLILTKEVSRFARDILDSIRYTRQLLTYNVGVLFEDIGLNTMECDAEFRLAIMASVAQEESRKLSERVKFGILRGSEKGVRRGAAPPIGYHFCDENNGYIIDEEKAPLVRYVFSEYAMGQKGLRTIAKELEDMGYKNAAGNRFNPSTLKRMIKNPVYAGNIVNGKTYKPSYRSKKKVQKDPGEWMLHHDPKRVPPLVDEETFKRANRILTGRAKAYSKKEQQQENPPGGRYAYSSKIFCVEHGCHYHRAVGRWRTLQGEQRAEYWRCERYKQYGKKGCNGPLLYTAELNRRMRQLFLPFKDVFQENAALLEGLLQEVLTQKNEQGAARILREMKEIDRKKEKLLQGWLNNVVADEDYQRSIKYLNESLEKWKKKLEETKGQDTEQERIGRILESMKEHCALLSDVLVEELVRALVKRIDVARGQEGFALQVHLAGEEKKIFPL